MQQRYLTVGTVLKPQGVRGEVKVLTETDAAEDFLGFPEIFFEEGGPPCKILSARVREGFAYLALEGVEDRDAAEALRGRRLLLPREQAAPLPENTWYVADLIGLSVVDRGGRPLGELIDVLQYGAADVYCVRGEKSFLFPALRRVIVSVDIAGRVMTVDESALSEVAVDAP